MSEDANRSIRQFPANISCDAGSITQAREALGTEAFASAQNAGATCTDDNALAELRTWLDRVG